jgi:hypothetical protein
MRRWLPHICVAQTVLAISALAQGQATGGALAQTGEHAAILSAIRQYALSYTSGLPNFTCAQMIRRFTSPAIGPRLRSQTDFIEEQLSFIEHREIHKITKINGTPAANLDPRQVPGAYSQGEFGNLLDQIFEPATQTAFEFDRSTRINGRRMNVVAFRVPQTHGYGLVEAHKTTISAYQGFVYAEEQSNTVMRIRMHCVGLPANSEFKSVELTVDYKRTPVAGQEFILPSHYSLHARRVDGDLIHDADYKSYRRFDADATIQFDEAQ